MGRGNLFLRLFHLSSQKTKRRGILLQISSDRRRKLNLAPFSHTGGLENLHKSKVLSEHKKYFKILHLLVQEKWINENRIQSRQLCSHDFAKLLCCSGHCRNSSNWPDLDLFCGPEMFYYISR